MTRAALDRLATSIVHAGKRARAAGSSLRHFEAWRSFDSYRATFEKFEAGAIHEDRLLESVRAAERAFNAAAEWAVS